MSGPVVAAVTRAIAFECEHGARFNLAMDRLWFWRLVDHCLDDKWRRVANNTAINHFLAVHRENRQLQLAASLAALFGGLGGRVGRGVPSEATAPTATRPPEVPASNTTPESLRLRLLRPPGGK